MLPPLPPSSPPPSPGLVALPALLWAADSALGASLDLAALAALGARALGVLFEPSPAACGVVLSPSAPCPGFGCDQAPAGASCGFVWGWLDPLDDVPALASATPLAWSRTALSPWRCAGCFAPCPAVLSECAWLLAGPASRVRWGFSGELEAALLWGFPVSASACGWSCSLLDAPASHPPARWGPDPLLAALDGP